MDIGELPLSCGGGGECLVVPGFDVEEKCVIFVCVMVMLLGEFWNDGRVLANEAVPDSEMEVTLSAVECWSEPEADDAVDLSMRGIWVNQVWINDIQGFNHGSAA